MRHELSCKLDNHRGFTDFEWLILNRMLNYNVKDKEIIKDQLSTAKVIGYCTCGCKTIDIEVERSKPRYIHPVRVPIEMTVLDIDKVPILLNLHVLDGYINELEILRADSKPLTEEFIFNNTEDIIE